MDYTWEKLSSREFEIIACNFAGDMFPGYEWKLTANTRDYNHDFFAKTEKLDKWGEAKHSEHEKFFRYCQCLHRQSIYALPER